MTEGPLLTPYRTTWEVGTPDAEQRLLPVIRTYLIDRGLDAEIALAGGSVELDGIRITTITGSEAPLSWFFSMHEPTGAYAEITLTREPDQLHIETSTDMPLGLEGLRSLMNAVAASDCGSVLSPVPVAAGLDFVPKLAARILDRDRTIPVIVAGYSRDLGEGGWQKRIREITSETIGMAEVYMLNEEATSELSTHLHPNLHVDPASVRVFLPRVGDDGSGSRRHRLFSPSNLVRMNTTELRTAMRQVVTSTRTDGHVTRARRTAERVNEKLSKTIVEQLSVPAPRRSPLMESQTAPRVDDAVLAELDQVKAALREREEDLGNTRGDMEYLQDEFYKTLNTNEDLLEEAELDVLAAEDDARRAREDLIQLQRHVERLQKELSTQGNAAAWEDPSSSYDLNEAPETMNELVDRLKELERYLVFTGDVSEVLDLENVGQMGRFAARSWDVLMALYDYARVQATEGFDGGVYNYLSRTPSGCHSFPIANYSSSESDTVLKSDKLSRERIFPVPEKVDPAGHVLMHSHFRVARWRSVSPRLYFYDDVANTGKIYVGYLGRHLTNTQT